MASGVHQIGEFLWGSAEAERDGVTPIKYRINRAFHERAGFTIFQEMGSGLGCRGKFLEKQHGIHGWFACKCWG